MHQNPELSAFSHLNILILDNKRGNATPPPPQTSKKKKGIFKKCVYIHTHIYATSRGRYEDLNRRLWVENR